MLRAPFRSIQARVGRIVGRTEARLTAVHGAQNLYREASKGIATAYVPGDGHGISVRPSMLDCSVTSSAPGTYLKELEMAGMVDNPEYSYNLVSVDERLNMLRERERRWTNLDWVWEATLAMPTNTSDPSYAHGGAMYLNIEDPKQNIIGLLLTRLPSKATEDIKWTEISLGKTILMSMLAIEEHDLLVCLTSCAQ